MLAALREAQGFGTPRCNSRIRLPQLHYERKGHEWPELAHLGIHPRRPWRRL